MNYLRSTIIGLIAVAVLYFGGVFRREPVQTGSVPQAEELASVAKSGWETKADEQPLVAVKVTPTTFDKDAKEWRFEVVFDTHSGSLDDDMLAVAALADDRGNVYRPTAWEGPGPGGHHREGVLVFNAITPVPSSIIFKIKNVGGVPERSFTWDIE